MIFARNFYFDGYRYNQRLTTLSMAANNKPRTGELVAEHGSWKTIFSSAVARAVGCLMSVLRMLVFLAKTS